MGFQQGLSGIGSASKQLDAIGNNVANSSTVGFKQSRAEFGDMFAASYYGVSGTQTGIGSATNSGAQQLNQGNVSVTNNQLDIAISGNGFFTVETSKGMSYTRNGQFGVDKNGYINNGGDKLMGWQVVPGSSPTRMKEGELKALMVPNSVLQPKPSDGGVGSTPATVDPIKIATNFDSRQTAPTTTFNPLDPTTYNHSTSTTLYDSLGNPLTMTTYYVKQQSPAINTWNVFARVNNPNMPETTAAATLNPQMLTPTNSLGGAVTTVGAAPAYTAAVMVFTSAGTLVKPAAGVTASATQTAIPIDFGSYASIVGANPLQVSMNVDSSTQYGNTFAVNEMNQVGYASASLTSLQVDNTGIIKVRYSNGQATDIGQVVLANFKNSQGLQSVGANRWIETVSSGPATTNNPGSSNVGFLQSGAVEDSNVDLTSELVNMISAQRYYQANAQTIKVQDTVLQTLINMR